MYGVKGITVTYDKNGITAIDIKGVTMLNVFSCIVER